MGVTAVGASADRTRVLVVDDNPSVREMVLRGFRQIGWQADGAADGLEALACLRHEGYDVIVSDFEMPRLNGLGLLREVRRGGASPPLVIQTTLLDPTLESLLLGAGAFRVVMKGSPIGDLVGSVEEVCRVAHASVGSHGPG